MPENIRPDYVSRKAADERRQEESAKAKQAADVPAIPAMTMAAFDAIWATKTKEMEEQRKEMEKQSIIRLTNVARSFNARFEAVEQQAQKPKDDNLQRLTKQDVIQIANDAVPASLRGLDSDPTRKTGDTLKLLSGYPTGSDKAVWGAVNSSATFDFSKVSLGFTKSGTAITILAGTIDRIAVAQATVTVANDGYIYVRRTIANNAMLVATAASVPANDATYTYYRLYQFSVTGTAPDEVATLKMAFRPFDIDGIIIPFGTAGSPHLIWNNSSGTWVIGSIEGIPAGGSQYQVLQRNGSGVAVWDWTRWAVEIT